VVRRCARLQDRELGTRPARHLPRREPDGDVAPLAPRVRDALPQRRASADGRADRP
jgi:hypothetical protein